MKGFSLRDYIVSAAIIIGVLAVWFFLMAGLLGIGNRQFSFSLAIVFSLIIYVFIKRRKPK